MEILLLIICLLVWLPMIIYQINVRSFWVLLMWLLIAPVASNLIEKPGANPLFGTSVVETESDAGRLEGPRFRGRLIADGGYLRDATTIRLGELLQPSRLLFVIFFALTLMNALVKKGRWVPLDAAEIGMVIFSLVIISSALFKSNRVAFSLRIAIDSFMVPFLAYYVTRRLIQSEGSFRRFTDIMAYVGIYVIGLAIVERLTHTEFFYRLRGPFPFRDDLYIVLMIVFCIITLDGLCNGREIGRKKALPVGIQWYVLCLTPIIIFLTWTRGNWLGFLSGTLVFLFMARGLFKSSQTLIGVSGLALVLTCLVIVGVEMFQAGQILSGRIDDSKSIYARLGAWTIQIQEGVKHPITGIGFNNVRDVLATTRTWIAGVKSETHSHNSFLAFFAELGGIGLCAYLAIKISIARMGLRMYRRGMYPQDRWRGVGLIAILVAYLVPAFTSSILYSPSLSHIYVYACLGGFAGLYHSGSIRLHQDEPSMRWKAEADLYHRSGEYR